MSARRSWAWPLVPLYAGAVAVKSGLRAAGVLKTQRLESPVVSVGSLSAGGAGKTPVVIALAELLRAREWAVDVLTRGYRRSGRGVERVQPEETSAADRYGDEPVLIAQRAGAPVWVGESRFAGGRAAEAAGVQSGMRVIHLLDDGFQHRQLERAVDIVLVTAVDLHDSLVPAGNLREPLSALRRADVVVVREGEYEQVVPLVKDRALSSAAIWVVRREVSVVEPHSALPQVEGPQKYLAFCAIARPEDFVRELRQRGIDVAESFAFRDHHRYTMEDMDRLIAAFDGTDAGAFITTEKDMVKLMPAMRAKLEARAPLAVAKLETHFVDEDGLMRDLGARLK